jgi:hypothetical protein
MSDAKSEAMELDLNPAQKVLLALAQAAQQIREHQALGGDDHSGAYHLRQARNRISDARDACSALMQYCGMREED